MASKKWRKAGYEPPYGKTPQTAYLNSSNMDRNKVIIFLSLPINEIGGARTVTERNLAFVKLAAQEIGCQAVHIAATSEDHFEHKKRLLKKVFFFFFRLNIEDVKEIRRLFLETDVRHVWIDHGLLGLNAIIARWFSWQARSKIKIHLYHHNDEVKYLRDELSFHRKLGKLRSRVALFLVGLKQYVGRSASDENYYISSDDQITYRNGMILPPSWSVIEPIDCEKSSYVLLVGSKFFANESGFRWYLDNVAMKLPLRSLIAGRGMDEIFADGPNHQVVGFVRDLSDLYRGARLVAVPIFMGSGVKIKLAEALNYGCQVVATKEASSGIWRRRDFIDSGQLLIATAEDFESTIRSVVQSTSPSLSFAENSFSHEVFERLFLARFLRGPDKLR